MGRRRGNWRCWILPVLAWLGATAASAQEIGHAEKIVNQVWGGALLYPLKPDQTVKFDEQINTGDASATAILFDDQSRLSIGPNALVNLDGLVYQPDRGMLRGVVKIGRGALRFAGSLTRKDLQIETPTMDIGVRGTVFNLVVSDSATEIEVVEGQVTTRSAGVVVVVVQGEFARSDGSGPARKLLAPATFRSRFVELDRMLGPLRRVAAPGALVPAAGPSPVVRTTDLKDAAGRPAGRLLVHQDGRIEAVDAQNHIRGFYDPVRNETRDDQNHVAGQGNRLRALLNIP